MGIFKPHVRYSRCNGETDIKTGRTPRFGYWLLVTCYSYYPTPRRALRAPPPPPQITTHANFVCAGPGVGRWALVRFRRGTKFPSAEGCRDTGPRENAIFVGGWDGVVRECGISYLLSCHSRAGGNDNGKVTRVKLGGRVCGDLTFGGHAGYNAIMRKIFLGFLLVLSLATAACGVKSSLTVPNPDYPRDYPVY